MAIFTYQGRTPDGELVSGQIEGASSDAVAAQLLQRTIMPITVVESKGETGLWAFLSRDIYTKKVSTEELIAFCQQMYTLLKAGVPILEALAYLVEMARTRSFAESLRGLINSISSGSTFSQAIRKYPTVFPNVMASMIEMGESSGQLDVVFQQLTEYLSLEGKTRKRMKSATRYPIMVIVALMIALGVVNFFVLPAFSTLFRQLKGTLPLPTRVLIGMSDFFTQNWIPLLVTIALTIFAIVYFVHQDKGRYLWHKWKLRIPVFGPILYRIILSRFARTFFMAIRSGISPVQSVELIANVVDNDFMRQKILTIRDGLEKGAALSATLKATELFSPFVFQMISVGEQSGSLDTMFKEVAEYYEREADYDLNRVGDLIEPIMLVIVGSMVLILALGVFLPMWNMVKLVQGP